MDVIWNITGNANFTSYNSRSTNLAAIDYQAHSPEHRIVSCAGIMILIVVALLGNALVCLAVYQSKNLQSNVNYFVVSLAISDMLVGIISMPIWMAFELTKFENLPAGITPDALIKGWTFVDILSGVASISNLVAISFERYWSIKSPLSHRMCMSNSYVVLNVLAVWSYSVIIASVYIGVWFWAWKVTLAAIAGFLLPLVLIIFAYINVYFIVRKIPTNIISRQENHTVTRTLCILVIAFVICWLPFFVVSITTIHCESCNLFVLKRQWIRSVVIWLHYLNSCCNPFLYCIFNAYYKDAFTIVLKKIFIRKHDKVDRRIVRDSRPISNITRSTADRFSSIHVPFLERERKPSEKSAACCVDLVDIPIKNVDAPPERTPEPRYFQLDFKEYAAKREMARALSRSDSTEI